MRQFNINSIIEHYGLNTEDLAKVLFPAVKYPKLAFDRVLKGETELDVQQVEQLASYLGIVVSDLFFVDGWKNHTENGCLTFSKGKYRAKLNYQGTYLSIYRDNQLIEQRISNASEMTIENFISLLNNIIKTYENGSN